MVFDEIEKGHPDIFNLLLQIMDEGNLTDSSGKSINFTHTVIILTSNLGAQEGKSAAIGFGNNEDKKTDSSIQAINREFSPEFRGRLDDIIIFNPLNYSVINMIIDKNLNALAKQLTEKNVTVSISDDVRAHIATRCSTCENGARMIERIITDELKQPIADEILFGKLKKGGQVSVNIDKTDDQTEHKTRSNQLPINTCPNIQPSNNEIEMQHEVNNRG